MPESGLLFSSGRLMKTSLIITLAAFAVQIVMTVILITAGLQFVFNAAFFVIMFFTVLAMYRSYAKHETNAMNILTGAVTGILLIYYTQRGINSLTEAVSVYKMAVYIIEKPGGAFS